MSIVPQQKVLHDPTEPASLLACAQSGCSICMDALLHQHKGLIYAVVRSQYAGKCDYADLIQEGWIGLWQAVLHFDPQRGSAFSTYAWVAIRNRIWNAVTEGWKADGWLEVERGAELLAKVASHWQAEQIRQALEAELESLPQRLRWVIEQAYGLGGEAPQTLAAIGQEMGVTGERVRQLRNEGLAILRLPGLSASLRQVCEQNSRQAYRKAGRLNQAWQRSRRGKR